MCLLRCISLREYTDFITQTTVPDILSFGFYASRDQAIVLYSSIETVLQTLSGHDSTDSNMASTEKKDTSIHLETIGTDTDPAAATEDKIDSYGLLKSRYDELSILRTLWVFKRVVIVSLAVYTGYLCEGFEVSTLTLAVCSLLIALSSTPAEASSRMLVSSSSSAMTRARE